MWQAILGGVIAKIVEQQLDKRLGSSTGSGKEDPALLEGKRAAYAYADHVLTEVQALVVKEPQKAVERIDEVRAGLKKMLGA